MGSPFGPYAALAVALVVFLFIDFKLFARGGEAGFRQGVIWSVGWLLISLLAGVIVLVVADEKAALFYVTVYLIERSLSLDNLFVFLLLFAYFGAPTELRRGLLFWGIVAALTLRGLAILGGITLINQFHFVIYLLGVALLFLAYRIFKGVEENVDPERNLMVRGVRKLFPVTGAFHGRRWFVKVAGKVHATPLFLCLVAIIFADLAFAIDSIPAAFAITRDPALIWMGNIFALLGLRALFVLVEELVKRFRFLDETIALVLGLVAIKLLTEDLVTVGPLASLAVVGLLLTGGIVASVIADRRDPDAERKREQRGERVSGPMDGEPTAEKEEAAAAT